jgi:hypothetical protein
MSSTDSVTEWMNQFARLLRLKETDNEAYIREMVAYNRSKGQYGVYPESIRLLVHDNIQKYVLSNDRQDLASCTLRYMVDYLDGTTDELDEYGVMDWVGSYDAAIQMKKCGIRGREFAKSLTENKGIDAAVSNVLKAKQLAQPTQSAQSTQPAKSGANALSQSSESASAESVPSPHSLAQSKK